MSLSAQPASILVFLFTDIEGSTRLWEQYPEAMQAALARHDAILDTAIAVHGGQIVKRTGDGIHASFAKATHGALAAAAVQRALQVEPWPDLGGAPLRVRMGLHAGESEARAGDYYGSVLNRAARIMAVAHGGQVLLSAVVASMLAEQGHPDLALLALGEHRLKDLARPEQIHQLLAPGLPTDFPPIKSLAATPNNLPLQLSTFVGRGRELELVKEHLAPPPRGRGVRLLTLTGVGGTGKTRLALQVGADRLESYPEGVWFVDLAPLADPQYLLATVSATLGIPESTDRPQMDVLVKALRTRRLLLILDNCEHLVETCAHLAQTLLQACPSMSILATSREALRLRGEHEFPVQPLPLPALDRAPLAAIAQAEAVQLFVARAQAARPSFTLDDTNASAVWAICTLLDGLPLALELAAALVRMYSPQALLTRLTSRSPSARVLSGGARDLPVRHQTLRNTIEWSYKLLDATEQRLFRWLGIFAGGFDLEAAEAVCSDATPPERLVADVILALVDKNLLRTTEIDGEPRFGMLRTIQDYALEQLDAHGERQEAHRRHADYFVALAERVDDEIRGPNMSDWLDRLEREHDNFRSVLEWSLGQGQTETAYRLGGSMEILWRYRGHDREGRQWLTRIAAMEGDVAPALRVKVLHRTAVRAAEQGDPESAVRYLSEGLLLTRSSDDKNGLADTVKSLGYVALLQNDFESGTAYLEQALTLEEELGGDPLRVAPVLELLASAMTGKKAFSEALEYGKQALALRQSAGDTTQLPDCYLTLAEVALAQEDYAQAGEYAIRGRSLSAEAKDTQYCAWADGILGRVALARGDLDETERRLVAGLQAYHALNYLFGRAEALEGLACLAAECGALERAARLWGAAEELRRSLGALPADSDRDGYERYVKPVRVRLGEAKFLSAKKAGAAMSLEEETRYALESVALPS